MEEKIREMDEKIEETDGSAAIQSSGYTDRIEELEEDIEDIREETAKNKEFAVKIYTRWVQIREAESENGVDSYFGKESSRQQESNSSESTENKEEEFEYE